MSYIGNIYRLKCLSTNTQYIGSTLRSLRTRLHQHEWFYKHYNQGTRSQFYTSFKILKRDNYIIELIEQVNFDHISELKQREQYYILNSENVVNNNIPSRTMKEYYIAKKDKYAERYQLKKNDDRYKKHYNCECGATYTINNKKHHMNTDKHKNNII
jgi:hypothetical protein